MDEIRLNKYLSEMGVCSRREADRLIEAGKVLVDGHRAAMGMKIFEGQSVICNGKRFLHWRQRKRMPKAGRREYSWQSISRRESYAPHPIRTGL